MMVYRHLGTSWWMWMCLVMVVAIHIIYDVSASSLVVVDTLKWWCVK